MHRRLSPAPLLAAPLAALICLASCSARSEYRAVVALDEAFVAAYPSVAAALEKPAAFEGPLRAALGASPKPVRIALSQGAGAALEAVRAAEARSSRPVALVASPLVASALVGGGVWKGQPPLLVPEWRGRPASGMRSASTDPVPAYREAGAALGAYLSALSREGGSPACGILFTEGPSRPRSALEAFAEAYSEASGGARLLVRELPAATESPAPAQPAEGSPAAPQAAGSAPPASAKSPSPEEAVREMLGADIRALFIAIGPETAAAARAASRPGLALGADYSYPDSLKALAFRIAPDAGALVEALARILKAPGDLGGDPTGTAVSVPARLEAGGSAASFSAGGRSLAAFLRAAVKEAAR